MTTLLYHCRSVGYVCKRIAEQSDNIQALCDKELGNLEYIPGRVIHWDSMKPVAADDIINAPLYVKLSRNKKKSRQVLNELSPKTWFNIDDIEYPCIIRPSHHHGGLEFFVCNNRTEAIQAIKQFCRGRWYASAIIDKTHEYRVFVYNNNVIKITRRLPPGNGGIAWNPSLGGQIIRVKRESWSTDVVNIALKAGQRLDLGWYAADVAVDTNRPYVLECNTAPGIHRQQTIEKFARIFSDV